MTEGEATPPARPTAARRAWADLGPRFASAFVLLGVTVVSLWLGGFIFAAVVGAVFAGAYREWEQVVTLKPLSLFGGILIAVVAIAGLIYPLVGGIGAMGLVTAAAIASLIAGGEAALWRAGGLMFFGLVIVAALAIRGTGVEGIWACLFLGVAVWMTDTGAFFAGRQIGGERLAPDISPGKTWSGAIGGFGLAVVAGTAVWIAIGGSPWWMGTVLAAALSILGQLGDLTESAIKRRFRVKDSGDIIPGHGGLMDRLDSITFALVFLLVVGLVHGGFGDVAAGILHW